MDRGRHHFVPQFYLRGFSSAPRQINVLHLKSGQVIEGASLREQCYRRNFHAPYEGLEANLSRFETIVGAAIERVLRLGRLPTSNSEDDATLRAFVAVQMSRTTRAARHASDYADAMIKILAARELQDLAERAKSIRIELTEPLRMSMAALENMLPMMMDLRLHLVQAGAHGRFITSDAPVFKYNLYCEGLQYVGTVGVAQAGFQAFLPLSPKLLLLLADPGVYKIGRRGAPVLLCGSSREVEQLNAMQAIVAEEVLLSAGTAELAPFVPLPHRIVTQRRVYNPTVTQAVNVNNRREGLVHWHEPVPNLKLDLSFLSVTREARRVPLADRPRIYRHEPPNRPMPPRFGTGTKVFRAMKPGESVPWLESDGDSGQGD